ncbi:MAG: redoxin family protein [Pseudomonadota bacterium]|nr:MAG: thioredoxin family protein [Pseudomonadota bacterium]
MRSSSIAILVLLSLPALAGAETLLPPDLLERPFPSSASHPLSLAEIRGDRPLLVVTFFSATCPCQRAHDVRLLELADAFGDRVAFVSVDSNVQASVEVARREKSRRRYPFPILVDAEGVLADALGARFATYSIVIDAEGRVRYAGGIDDDRNRLRPDARLYLRDALVALLDGREPDLARTKVFGCFLRRR